MIQHHAPMPRHGEDLDIVSPREHRIRTYRPMSHPPLKLQVLHQPTPVTVIIQRVEVTDNIWYRHMVDRCEPNLHARCRQFQHVHMEFVHPPRLILHPSLSKISHRMDLVLQRLPSAPLDYSICLLVRLNFPPSRYSLMMYLDAFGKEGLCINALVSTADVRSITIS